MILGVLGLVCKYDLLYTHAASFIHEFQLAFSLLVEMDRLILLLLISTLVSPTLCFPTGAPADACVNLTPSHGVSSQPESTLPYELVINDFVDPSGVYQYVPGVTYTGTCLSRLDVLCADD